MPDTTTPATPTPDTLSALLDFGHVVRVHPDGTVTDAPGTYAPELLDESLSDSTWTLLDGWSSQYRYSGPVMHPSEYVGGNLARHVLATPGLWAVIGAYFSCDGECDPCTECPSLDGWALAYRDA